MAACYHHRSIVIPVAFTPTLLADLVDTSQRVGEQSSRRAKIADIAALLRRLAPDEIEIGVSWLAGATRQGRSGIGYALIRDARPATSASKPSLTLVEVDAALDRIAKSTGAGSVSARTSLLSAVLQKASSREQDFLTNLLSGELRQGALEGLMIEAVAAAADVSADAVRRASMVAGGIAAVAVSALTTGAAGLNAYSMSLFQPLAPMLAQPAEDIDEAMGSLASAASVALEWKLDGARVQVHKRDNEVHIYSRLRSSGPCATPTRIR